jgi:predicted short-subunit dehydrogenase-like oxidoreductase (DUF2520 family)
MRFRKTAGLVGAGGVGRSFLARMPALLARVGPVKGASLHVSRRIANSLRAGTGVGDYSALAKCGLLFLAVPEKSIDETSRELAEAFALAGKMVVLCEVLRDSSTPSPLRTGGAKVATLNCVPESDEKLFVAEGHPATLAALQQILTLDHRKLVLVKPAAKPLYLSGIHIAGHLLLPWIAGAVESLRAAGFSRSEATRTVHALGSRALRSYEKAGQKAWKPAAAESFHRVLQRDIDALRLTDRRLAMLYSESFDQLMQFFAAEPKRAPMVKRHAT